MKTRLLFVLVSALVLSGCAGLWQVERVADLSPQQLQQIHSIRVVTGEENITYKSLGMIKGLSCKGSPYSGASTREDAMMQLKIKAVKLGANGILFPTCSHDVSVDWSNNCWESWVCMAEAIVIVGN